MLRQMSGQTLRDKTRNEVIKRVQDLQILRKRLKQIIQDDLGMCIDGVYANQ